MLPCSHAVKSPRGLRAEIYTRALRQS